MAEPITEDQALEIAWHLAGLHEMAMDIADECGRLIEKMKKHYRQQEGP